MSQGVNTKMTDDEVEAEIERLKQSPHVKLAKKAERLQNRRRQYMHTLRCYERKGKKLEEDGWTMERLEQLAEEYDS